MPEKNNLEENQRNPVGDTKPHRAGAIPCGRPRSGGDSLLQGKRILVTRTLQQASALSERLRALGAIPIEFPTIQIVPPQDWGPLDNALKRLCMTSYYTWLVFTSANGVNICFERLHSIGYAAGAVGNVRIAAIGPATAAALAHYGVTADLVPHEYIAEGVAAALIEDAWQREESLQGKRILLARAAEARKILVSALQQAGAVVDEVVAYHTVPVAGDDEQGREVLHLLRTHQLDILTFTSSSTVRNFMHWLIESCGEATQIDVVGEAGGVGPTPPRGREGIETRSASSAEGPYGISSLAWLGDARPRIACIGPITAQTARELGLDVDIEAREFTIDGLVEAIVRDQEEA